MKKIFSIVLALVLVLSFSLATTTSVVADVSKANVTVDPKTVLTAANYTIVFNITSTLNTGETISIKFPSDTTVPHTYATGDVTVQGVDVSSVDIDVDGQEVTFRTPIPISWLAPVTVVFNVTAGIINPTNKGDYNLYVKTQREQTWVTSEPYTIVLPDKSMYEFVYEPEPEDMTIYEDEPAALNLTLKTKVLGLAGYNSTRITFTVTYQPPGSSVTFNVSCSPGAWNSTTDYGQCPGSGNYTVPKVYNETFPLRLTFNMVGLYTIEFVFEDLEPPGEDLIVEEISFAVTGVSFDVPLNKGWNLMSLPIVPDVTDIEEVLASIEDDFISVHHYSASTGEWSIYAPPPSTWDSLEEMKDGKAYWINMSAATNLTVVGQAVAPPGYGPPPPSYPVLEGWNMVGFREREPMEVEVYLDGTAWVMVYGFNLDQNGWFPVTEGQNMTPGLGYWVAFSGPGTIYP